MATKKPLEYSFSYSVDTVTHNIAETPITAPTETVPLDLFCKSQSTMQAIARYLVDVRKLSFSRAARLLGRSAKTIWASYHQTTPLDHIDTDTLPIPLHIFSTARSPLESLVCHLKAQGLRNAEIARLLRLDPRTIWTAARRGEGKQ